MLYVKTSSLISHEIMQKFNCTANVAFHETAFVALTTMLPICTNCVEKFVARTKYASERGNLQNGMQESNDECRISLHISLYKW